MAGKGKINESQIKCKEWSELSLKEMLKAPFSTQKENRVLKDLVLNLPANSKVIFILFGVPYA
jgi:hypothetical protein